MIQKPLIGFALFFTFLGGCGKGYIPSVSQARQAVEAALNAWKNGQKVGKIDTGSFSFQAVDSVWFKGRKLESFEILSEETTPDGMRRFSVRLQMKTPKATETVNYVVVGIAPLWVYRQEDFDQTYQWEGMKDGK